MKKILNVIPKGDLAIVGITLFSSILALLPRVANGILDYKYILEQYFTDSRLSLIASITFILIGIYATITSVFGSSRSMATSELSEKDLTEDYIIIIIMAMISAFILSLYIIFAKLNVIWLIGLIIWTFYNLLRFLILILLMYNYNVKTSKKAEYLESEKYEKLMDVLTEIKIELNSKKK